MKSRRILTSVFVPLILLLVAVVGLTYAQGTDSSASRAPQALPGISASTPLSTSFTYQGQLELDGEPVNETCDMAFRLYDAASGGNQVGSAVTHTVTISDGLFTQPLDFGTGVFTGNARWLGIEVMCPNDDSFTDLGRQELTAAPYAHYALSAGALQGYPVTTTTPTVGQVLEWDGTSWRPAPDDDTTDGLLPSGAMVLGTYSDTALVDAGFYPTLRSFNGWDIKTSMPTGREMLGAVTVDGIIYAIGGPSSGENEAYDPVTDSWVERAPMPTARQGVAVVEVDGVIYAIGGSSAVTTCETTVEAYYPISDTWVTRASMPTGRQLLAAVAVDGLIYAIGGNSCDNNYETTVEAYNPITDSWIDRMPMPTGRHSLAAAEMNGVIYAIGGVSSGFQYETANEAYYPITNTWVSKAPMPSARFGLGVAAADGVIHAVGGSRGSFRNEHETYEPVSDAWETRIQLLVPRRYLAVATVNSSLYVIGGTSIDNESDLNEVYHPPLYVYRKD
jgi:hypothetical protein